MHKLKVLGCAAVAFASLAVAAVFDDTYTFKRKVKLNEEVKYSLKGELAVMGLEASLTALVTQKVIDIDKDGNYTVESSQVNAVAMVNDQEMKIPDSSSKSKYAPDGTLLQILGNNGTGEAYRTAAMTLMIAPPEGKKIGETWTAKIKPDSKTGAVEANAEYKVEGIEKIGTQDCVKVSAKIAETGSEPASSESTVWFSLPDYADVKQVSKLKDVPFPAAPAPISGTITMTRVD